MQYIATYINEPISAEDVVAISSMSRTYLFKILAGVGNEYRCRHYTLPFSGFESMVKP